MSVAATERELVYEGMRTPWGPAQSARILIPGIGLVDTAGHGGLKLSRERNKRVPAYAHDIDGGWYEEDCACNIPLTIFREELMRDGPDWIKESLTKHDPALTWKQCFPDSYSRYFNVTVTAAESCIIRDREFTAAHLNDYEFLEWTKDRDEARAMAHAFECVRNAAESYRLRRAAESDIESYKRNVERAAAARIEAVA